MKREIKVFQNPDELSRTAAENFIEIGRLAIERNGKYSVVLAGGSTPKSLYKLLATEEFRSRIDWRKVFFFFGDERNVLPSDEESNFRMANENLLKPLEIPAENVFRWETEIENAEDAAAKYERRIRDFFDARENEFPVFDLILLGMGADGHTASLFPETAALKENNKIAAANRVEKLGSIRLTLTFPVINCAQNVIFLVTGNEKAETLKIILEGEFEPDKFPAQMVLPENGKLLWLADKSAAHLLNN